MSRFDTYPHTLETEVGSIADMLKTLGSSALKFVGLNPPSWMDDNPAKRKR